MELVAIVSGFWFYRDGRAWRIFRQTLGGDLEEVPAKNFAGWGLHMSLHHPTILVRVRP